MAAREESVVPPVAGVAIIGVTTSGTGARRGITDRRNRQTENNRRNRTSECRKPNLANLTDASMKLA